jgi:hypothetical protein
MLPKQTLLLVIGFIFLIACKSKTEKGISTPKAISINDTAKTKNIDTSLIYLKARQAVPLIENLCQLWRLDDADKPHWNELLWDTAEDKRKFPELALFKDFTCTKNARCGIKFGKWELDKTNRILWVTYSDGLIESYIVQTIAKQKMTLTSKMGFEQATLFFSSDGMEHKRPIEDPFYPDNNRWRIKPKASENYDQILSRVRQYVHFYALFFKDCYQREQTDISFIGLPHCIIWYNGGIGLPLRMAVEKNWVDCFYSEREALIGYDILSTFINRRVLVWPENPNSWIKETYEILDQMYSKLGS